MKDYIRLQVVIPEEVFQVFLEQAKTSQEDVNQLINQFILDYICN